MKFLKKMKLGVAEMRVKLSIIKPELQKSAKGPGLGLGLRGEGVSFSDARCTFTQNAQCYSQTIFF